MIAQRLELNRWMYYTYKNPYWQGVRIYYAYICALCRYDTCMLTLALLLMSYTVFSNLVPYSIFRRRTTINIFFIIFLIKGRKNNFYCIYSATNAFMYLVHAYRNIPFDKQNTTITFFLLYSIYSVICITAGNALFRASTATHITTAHHSMPPPTLTLALLTIPCLHRHISPLHDCTP